MVLKVLPYSFIIPVPIRAFPASRLGGGLGGGWGKMLFPATQSCQGKEWGPATWAGPKGRLARAPARAI
ncbi:unnamed protein product [Prunus armeniaca]